MKKKRTIFRAAPGAMFDDKKAQAYGSYLTRLGEEQGRTITSTEVLHAARSEDSPIHDYFEWDDSEAAEKYRLVQARSLIQHVEVQVIYDDEERWTKAFHNVTIQEAAKNRRIYVSADVVATDEYFRRQVIASALKEVRRWQERYREYKELDLIFGAIERTQRTLDLHVAQEEGATA